MTPPLVSVVVATYNRAPRLVRALDSVAAQTFRNWECLVCDDGSTDGTVAIVDALASRDPRFRLLSGPHAGRPAVPRNWGLKAARGEWIAFLDDDDRWHPHKLDRQLAAAQRFGCDAISVRALEYVEPHEPVLGTDDGRQTRVDLRLGHLLTHRRPYPHTSATMVRRRFLLDVAGFAESPAYRAVEDFDCWARLLAGGARWVLDNGVPLVAYRDQGLDSISSWNRVLDPDVIRQRWAQLECVTRIASDTWSSLGHDRSTVLDNVIRRADDCAGRCMAAGWPVAASAAYLVAGLGALRLRRIHQAALWGCRALRVLIVPHAKAVHRSPDVMPVLVQRSLRFGFRLATGHCGRSTALPVGAAGEWSRVADVKAICRPNGEAARPV